MSTAQAVAIVERQPLVTRIAQHYGVEPAKLLATLKATVFRTEREASDAEMVSLLVVAEQYKLNPFTKELFAFADKHKGIVPIVSVDGWARIVNEHPQFNGVTFEYGGTGPDWVKCIIYRKDREHPIQVTEFMEECKRGTGPWQSHPSRMLRHKAYIQCARLAFGFAGIYDEDEAERIIEAGKQPAPTGAQPKLGAAGLKDRLEVDTGTEKTVGTLEKRDEFIAAMKGSTDQEVLDLARDQANAFAWTDPDKNLMDETYRAKTADLAGPLDA